MSLKLVSPKSIKQDPRGVTLWFNDGDRNVYIVHDDSCIYYFEISEGQDIVQGENGRPLKYGKISSDRLHDHFYKGTRIVNMVHDVPRPVRDKLSLLVEECELLRPELADKILYYLRSTKVHELAFKMPLPNYESYLNDISRAAQKKRPRKPLTQFQQFVIIFSISITFVAIALLTGAYYLIGLMEKARGS